MSGIGKVRFGLIEPLMQGQIILRLAPVLPHARLRVIKGMGHHDLLLLVGAQDAAALAPIGAGL